jgi:hypothetical protein
MNADRDLTLRRPQFRSPCIRRSRPLVRINCMPDHRIPFLCRERPTPAQPECGHRSTSRPSRLGRHNGPVDEPSREGAPHPHRSCRSRDLFGSSFRPLISSASIPLAPVVACWFSSDLFRAVRAFHRLQLVALSARRIEHNATIAAMRHVCLASFAPVSGGVYIFAGFMIWSTLGAVVSELRAIRRELSRMKGGV